MQRSEKPHFGKQCVNWIIVDPTLMWEEVLYCSQQNLNSKLTPLLWNRFFAVYLLFLVFVFMTWTRIDSHGSLWWEDQSCRVRQVGGSRMTYDAYVRTGSLGVCPSKWANTRYLKAVRRKIGNRKGLTQSRSRLKVIDMDFIRLSWLLLTLCMFSASHAAGKIETSSLFNVFYSEGAHIPD